MYLEATCVGPIGTTISIIILLLILIDGATLTPGHLIIRVGSCLAILSDGVLHEARARSVFRLGLVATARCCCLKGRFTAALLVGRERLLLRTALLGLRDVIAGLFLTQVLLHTILIQFDICRVILLLL